MPDSLSVVMVVRKYRLTSFKVLFARSLSVEVTGFIEQQRLNLVMNLLHLRLTAFTYIFLKVFDFSCFKLGSSIESPEPSLDPLQPFLCRLQNSSYHFA